MCRPNLPAACSIALRLLSTKMLSLLTPANRPDASAGTIACCSAFFMRLRFSISAFCSFSLTAPSCRRTTLSASLFDSCCFDGDRSSQQALNGHGRGQ